MSQPQGRFGTVGARGPDLFGDIQFSLWQSPFVAGLDVVVSSTHSHYYPLHLHEALEIIWVREGCAIFECRGRRVLLAAGDACAINPCEFHSGGSCGGAPVSFCLIHVPQQVMPPEFPAEFFGIRNGGRSLPIKLIPRRCADRTLPEFVTALLSDRDFGAQLRSVSAGLEAILDAEARRRAESVFGTAHHPAIEHVKAIICSRYAEPLNVEALAGEVNLNERYLISLFRSTTGIPPHQFQIALRVDNARRLLPSETPLSTIAASSGFADQSHFNRHFKRQYGFTPGAFRRMFVPQ
jgi:AraC-like DNA-binding protein